MQSEVEKTIEWLKTTATNSDNPAHFSPRLREAASLIETLYRDKERLDFLDRLNSRLNAHYGTNYYWRLITNHNVNRLMIGHMAVDLNDAEANGLPSCREAIDARMVDFAPRALAGDHGQAGGAQG